MLKFIKRQKENEGASMSKLYYCIIGLLGLLNLAQAQDDAVSDRKRPREQYSFAARAGGDGVREDVSLQYAGQYVVVDHNGVVHINQKMYPDFRMNEGTQFFTCDDEITYSNGKYYHQVGEPIFRDEMVFWDLEEIELSDIPFVPQPVEARLTENPYEIVAEEDCKTSPYFSCGRLNMSFPPAVSDGPDQRGSGSAAAIEPNILVTAAHNFMPPTWNGVPNRDKVKANSVRFLHIKTRGKERVACEVSTLHCFVHPKWEESFDPYYDVAFVFLNQSLTSTQEEKDRLLSLHVLSPALEHSIQVVGYPRGVSEMRRTTGDVKAREDRPVEAMNIVYHTANTEPGSSGSPIVRDGRSLVGVHTRAPSPGGTMNRGVRIRLDLMPFLDEMVAQNQQYLADAVAYEAEKMAKKARDERQRIEEIEARGRADGEARGEIQTKQAVARALIADGDSDAKIIKTTGLTQEQVQALRASLAIS